MPVLGPNSAATNNQYDDQSLPRNTVHDVVETPMLAVKYTDGYGKTQMRLVVMIEDQPFLLEAKISENAKMGQKWFAAQIAEKLNPSKKKGRTRKRKAKVAPPVATEVAAAPPINTDAL
jgi:hypothetical protein